MTADAMVLEQIMTGTVIGEMLGLPGNGLKDQLPDVAVRLRIP